MAKGVIAMQHVSKLFQEKDSWETSEIYDRLIDMKYRNMPTKTQLHRLLLKEHYNVNSKSRHTLALWKKKPQKEKLVEVFE